MPVIQVTHSDDPRLDPYVRLSDHQLRSVVEPSWAQMICESSLVIEVALDAGLVPLSFLIEEKKLGHLAGMLARVPKDIPVYVAPAALMSEVAGFRVTRGVFGCFPRQKPLKVSEALRGARRVAVVENIVDVSNVGALFRSAAALGIDAVLLAPSCADPLCRRALRVSMGTVLKIPWAKFTKPWPQRGFALLHDAGFCCAAFTLDPCARRLDDPSLVSIPRLALCFGTEGAGLTQGVVAACDLSVRIPMSHGVDSLNVAAAAAVAFWQLCRHPL